MCIENSEVKEAEEDVVVLQGPKNWKMFQPCRAENHYLCSEETQDSKCLCLCHEEELYEQAESEAEKIY